MVRKLVAATAAALVATALVATPVAALSGTDTRLHDPSAIVVGGCTYAFSTGFENDPANPTGSITQYKSCSGDAVTGWTKVQNLWSTTPSWITASLGRTPPNIWAPDINYFGGQYHLYYGASMWGTADAVMGLLTADSIEGPWVDQGMVTNVHYPIDPDLVRGEDGRLYISWGSWTGGASYMHVVDESTGKLSTTDNNLWTIAKGVEGVSIVRNGDYFYMFGSKGSCCSGVNSTYYTSVARSSSVTGPYIDINGVDMVSGGGTRILSGFGQKIAAGGGDVFFDGSAAKFAYHYYDGNANGRETLDIRPLSFVDGWPVFGTPIGTIVPSSESSVSGRPVPGQSLQGTPAQFDKSGTQLTYQWLRNGVAIAGAISTSYTPTADDVNAQITFRTTATRDGYDTGVSTSSPVKVVAQPPLVDGIAAAQSTDLTGYTQGSAETFRREVAAVAAAAALPNPNEQQLRDRLTDAAIALVPTSTLLTPIPVQRAWVVASSPAYGNGESPAANGWRLFDGDLTTNVDTTGPNGWVSVTAPADTALSVARLEVYPRAGLAQRIVGHKFQGSNDGGATWQTFATVSTATDGQWTVIDLPTAVSFKQVRMLDDHGGYTNAAEVHLVTRAADTSLVDLLLGDTANLVEASYSAESWSALESAIDAARIVDRSAQPAIDAASQSLRDAIAGLKPPAPVITATVNSTVAGENGWLRGTASVALEVTKGVGTIQYRVDNGAWTSYTLPISVTAEGTHTVDYRGAQDGAPVESSVGSVPVNVDSIAPSTSVTVSPAGGVAMAGQAATATFTAIDATSGIARTEYSVGDGPWQTVGDEGVSVTEKGVHVVTYRSVDVAGNVEQQKEVTLTVADPDATAIVKITSADTPTDGWYQQPVVVAISAPKSGQKVQYALNGGIWKNYSSPITVSADGTTKIAYRLQGADGKVVVGSNAEAIVNVDKTAPFVSATRDPSTGKGSPRNPITVDFSADDAHSGVASIEYRVNGGSWKTGDGPVTFDSEGDYVVSYRATDVAGNSSSIKSTSVTITANPATTVKAAPTVTAGKELVVSMDGFPRWSNVTIKIGQTTVGQIITDVNGSARITVRTPAYLAKEKTTLLAEGAGVSATTSITVK